METLHAAARVFEDRGRVAEHACCRMRLLEESGEGDASPIDWRVARSHSALALAIEWVRTGAGDSRLTLRLSSFAARPCPHVSPPPGPVALTPSGVVEKASAK